MGKRYYCEYCDKTMVATPGIVKTHNKGLFHQKLVQEHYQKYKDPETILKEEGCKNPCTRFLQGTCQFGSICRYSHYTKEQLDWYRQYVSSKNAIKSDSTETSFETFYNDLRSKKPEHHENTVLYDKNGFTYVFPWSSYNIMVDDKILPPSLKKFTIDDFESADIQEWG